MTETDRNPNPTGETADPAPLRDAGETPTPPPQAEPRPAAPESVGGGATPPPARGGAGVTAMAALALALVAVAFAGWQWLDLRNRLGDVQEGVARKLAQFEAAGHETRAIAEAAQEASRETAVMAGVLESKLSEFQNHQVALEALYQELARGRDEWTLAEVEQILLIAGQQLQLAGNVKAALVAMQTADARLQRVDKPQLIPLRQAIARDIERLKATPYVDVAGLSLRLNGLSTAVETLPLAVENRAPAPQPKDAGRGEPPAWRRLLLEVWDELRGLVRIHQVGKAEAPLLAPEQVYFLRENLRLRLLAARIALLQRDQQSYVQDLSAAREWVQRYFDTADRRTALVLRELEQMLGSPVDIELPDISASLNAVRDYKLVEGGRP